MDQEWLCQRNKLMLHNHSCFYDQTTIQLLPRHKQFRGISDLINIFCNFRKQLPQHKQRGVGYGDYCYYMDCLAGSEPDSVRQH